MIGAGGIGFDVSEFLVTDESPTLNLKEWKAEWGALDPQEAPEPRRADDADPAAAGARGLPAAAHQGRRRAAASARPPGWVHRASLKAKGVQQLSGVNYERIDDDGLHISFGSDRSEPRVLAVDNVVICAGQESVRDLEDGLRRTRRRAARHRRRGRRRRARRQAGDPPGHRARRPALAHASVTPLR